jgi:isoquinoline 1-oxidoreductase subunit beta
MNAHNEISRRRFLVLAGAAGAAGIGLVIGARTLLFQDETVGTRTNGFKPWLSIDFDGSVTLFCGRSEMGQGIYTGMAQLVGEELDCDWQKLKVETGPADRAFVNIYGAEELMTSEHSEPDQMSSLESWVLGTAARYSGMQFTAASTGIRDGFVKVREVGATARVMLIQAAAQKWGVPVGECDAEAGIVRHVATGRRLGYGELAVAAAKLRPPSNVPLKPSSAWRLIGRNVARLDVPSKTDGSATFGIDVRRPNMLFAAVANCPEFGGTLKRFDAAATLKLPGVKAVQAVPGGIAVVADTTWRAKRALASLGIDWESGPNAQLSSANLQKRYLEALSGPLKTFASAGDLSRAMKTAKKTVEAEYSVPFLAHAPMEPINCTAEVSADGVDVWAPTQNQTKAQDAAAKVAGVPASKVRIHTTLIGGAFGRRGEVDFVVQAVTLAKSIKRPVQVTWSRGEDLQHDFYRPMEVARLTAGLDETGMPVAWRYQAATTSIYARLFPPILWVKNDLAISQGAAEMAYAFPNHSMEISVQKTLVPVGAWRSVGHSQNAHFEECFLDEVAAAGGSDPVELRRRLLTHQPRMLAVLERVAKEGNWGKPLPPGHGRGVALHPSCGSFIAEIAEVAVENNKVRVKRVVAAIDCGMVVNPDSVKTQIQGGIVFGMTAALYGKITVEKGCVTQKNFPDYNMVRLAQMPEIEVHIIPSTAYPGGVGQPATPPIAPAIVNAIFAATGRRVRSLPLIDNGFIF